MPNFIAQNGNGQTASLKATGSGVDSDPYVINHSAALQVGGNDVSTTNPVPTADQTLVNSLGTQADTPAASDTPTNATIFGLLKRLLQKITGINLLLPTTLTSAGGLRVDGSVISFSPGATIGLSSSTAIVTTPPTANSATQVQGAGAAGATTVGNPTLVGGASSDGKTRSLTLNTDGTIPPPTGVALDTSVQSILVRLPAVGQKASSDSLPVVLSTDGPFTSYATVFGNTTDVAAADDGVTAVSYLALFKRSLQRLTTLLGVLPSALTAAGGINASGSNIVLVDGTTASQKASVNSSGQLAIAPISIADFTTPANKLSIDATYAAKTTFGGNPQPIYFGAATGQPPVWASDLRVTYTNAVVVKSSAGYVRSLYLLNTATSARYLLLLNQTTVPTAGSQANLMGNYLVPASGNLILGADIFGFCGLSFSTGIAWAWSSAPGTFTNPGTFDGSIQLFFT